ncbi:hypothetical protein ACFLW7_00490 [Chloroflexota bacterium]
MNCLTLIANILEKYVMEMAVIALLILYVVQIINIKRLRELGICETLPKAKHHD